MHSVTPRAIGLVCASAILWGVYWMPVRALSAFGITGISTALLLALSGFIASLPFLLKGKLIRGKRGAIGWQHVCGALSIGIAFTLYGIALSYTDIVRVVLLFYLAPAWSTLIECLFFGRRFTLRSFLGLCFSFLGIVVIFRGELPIDGLGALGDWLALFAGLAWSVGSALMFMSKQISVPAMSSASFGGAVIVSGIVFLLFETDTTVLLSDQNRVKILLVCTLLGFFYLLPVTALTLWGATQIPPAMMSFLLTLEVVSAVGSSALLLGERFGLIELAGTALIIAGAMVEVVRTKTSASTDKNTTTKT